MRRVLTRVSPAARRPEITAGGEVRGRRAGLPQRQSSPSRVGPGADRLPAGGLTGSQALRREERFDRLQRAVGELGPEEREVLLLSRIEGLTMREIAERTGRSGRNVKYLLARALKELKRRFGDTESLSLPDRELERGGERDAD